MNGDLGEAFKRLKEAMFVKYRGCTIFNGYFVDWNGNTYPDLDSAKLAIDSAYEQLGNSINKERQS